MAAAVRDGHLEVRTREEVRTAFRGFLQKLGPNQVAHFSVSFPLQSTLWTFELVHGDPVPYLFGNGWARPAADHEMSVVAQISDAPAFQMGEETDMDSRDCISILHRGSPAACLREQARKRLGLPTGIHSTSILRHRGGSDRVRTIGNLGAELKAMAQERFKQIEGAQNRKVYLLLCASVAAVASAWLAKH